MTQSRAQSRVESSTPSALSITQALDEHLVKIERAFTHAFNTAGYDGIFSDFWNMISPTHFPCDDLTVINKYYNNQPKRIPIILEARGLQDIPFDKKLILKAVSDLCHSLARIKYIIDKLSKTLPGPELVSAAFSEVYQQMNSNIQFGAHHKHDIHREIASLENYFYNVGVHLIALGYLREEGLFGHQQRDRDSLPSHLHEALAKLKDNNALNALIDPIETAKKAGRNTAEYCKPLNDEMLVMVAVQRELAAHNEAVIQRLDRTVSQTDADKLPLAEMIASVERNVYIFQLCPIISELQNERACPGLAAAMKNIMGVCDKSCSYISASTLGMVSDPWLEAKKTVGDLSVFNEKLMLFLNSYSGISINPFDLHQQYGWTKQQYQELCAVSAELNKKIESAKQADQRYQQAISHTVTLLQDHLQPVKSDSLFAFVGRHWDKMAAGGAIGGTAAVAVVLLSTNPIFLAACIAGGVAMGTAGGTGGGLIEDVVKEKRQKKKIDSALAVNTGVKSYGSFWRSESAAAAAAPQLEEESQSMAKTR